MKQNSLSKIIKKVTPVVLIDEDEQKKKNFSLIGKMFGNMAESINVEGNRNNLFIKNNVSNNNNKFPGGFKQAQGILKNNQSNNKTTLQQKGSNKQSKPLDFFTVYDEFGLINESINNRQSTSKGKPKYRDDLTSQPNNPFKLQDPSTFTDMKNNRKQQFQQVMQNNYVNLHEYYDLAKEKGREQTVVHVKSSMDSLTLENVEAKLEAHRRELRNVESMYKAKKGIVEQDGEEGDAVYGNSSYQPHKAFTKTSENDPYKQYGKTQSQIYEMIKKNQKQDENQIVVDQMWEQKLKQNPKLLEYSKKYEEYLVQKDAKNILYSTVRQNLFKWQKYKKPINATNKSATKLINPQKSLSKSRQKSISKLNKSLQKFQHQSELQHSQIQSTSIHDVLASKDDKFIAKYIFAQVDTDKRGLLSKEELLDYITKNEHIIKSYNIDLKWIYTDLDNYETKRKGMLNKEELGIFLATFQSTFHPQIKLTDVSQLSSQLKQQSSFKDSSKPSKQSPFQIYFSQDMHRFRNLFEKLDLNEDKILKRQEFVQNIYIDPDCSKVLDKVVIRIKIIEKQITFRQIIGFLLDDYRKEKNEKLKKSKEYITFNRFCEYFEFPQSIHLKSLTNKKKAVKATPTNQIQIFDLQEQNLFILKDLFDTIPRVYQDFIVVADFIQTALVDPQVLSFQEDMCRIQSVETSLPIETVRLTLQRIIKEADQYIDWETTKGFFSRRGRPMDWNEALIREKKAVRQEQRAKSINEVLKRELILKNELEVSAKMKSQYQTQQKRQSEQNFTIPQPFKITDEIKTKETKKANDKGQAEFKDVAKQLAKTTNFKAKPVNKQILGKKPDLVLGKRPASSSKVIPQYKYENYQNDRIQRALKRAQQKHMIQEKQRQIKDMANIKARNDAAKLAEKLFTEVKQQKKKVKASDKPKKQLTQLEKQIAQRLHPSSKDDDEKLMKFMEKKKKLQLADELKKDRIKEELKRKEDANKRTQEKTSNIKKEKQQQEKKLKEMAADSEQTFKPKLNKKIPLTEDEKKTMQEAKQARKAKQNQVIEKRFDEEERKKRERRNKIPTKDPYTKLDDLSKDQILDKIYEINFLNILIDSDQVEEFNKDHDFTHKDKKQREMYLTGMANKFRIVMEKEERVMKELKIRQTEEKQQQNIMIKQKSNISQKGKSDKMKSDMIFHGSKALQRYRKLQQGLTPSQVPSEFDRYKDDDFDEKKDKKVRKQKKEKAVDQDQDQEQDQD